MIGNTESFMHDPATALSIAAEAGNMDTVDYFCPPMTKLGIKQ